MTVDHIGLQTGHDFGIRHCNTDNSKFFKRIAKGLLSCVANFYPLQVFNLLNGTLVCINKEITHGRRPFQDTEPLGFCKLFLLRFPFGSVHDTDKMAHILNQARS